MLTSQRIPAPYPTQTYDELSGAGQAYQQEGEEFEPSVSFVVGVFVAVGGITGVGVRVLVAVMAIIVCVIVDSASVGDGVACGDAI